MSEDMEYKTECLNRLMVFYKINHGVKIEYEKQITIEDRKVKTTVLTGLFSTGMTVYTHTIDDWIKSGDDEQTKVFKRKFIEFCLLRHVVGDCGDVCIEDFLTNEESIKTGERTMSVYHSPLDDEQTIWIITEWDRSYTTVLDPMDY